MRLERATNSHLKVQCLSAQLFTCLRHTKLELKLENLIIKPCDPINHVQSKGLQIFGKSILCDFTQFYMTHYKRFIFSYRLLPFHQPFKNKVCQYLVWNFCIAERKNSCSCLVFLRLQKYEQERGENTIGDYQRGCGGTIDGRLF